MPANREDGRPFLLPSWVQPNHMSHLFSDDAIIVIEELFALSSGF